MPPACRPLVFCPPPPAGGVPRGNGAAEPGAAGGAADQRAPAGAAGGGARQEPGAGAGGLVVSGPVCVLGDPRHGLNCWVKRAAGGRAGEEPDAEARCRFRDVYGLGTVTRTGWTSCGAPHIAPWPSTTRPLAGLARPPVCRKMRRCGSRWRAWLCRCCLCRQTPR